MLIPVSVPEMQVPAISASHSFEVRKIHPGISERLATDAECRLLLEPRGTAELKAGYAQEPVLHFPSATWTGCHRIGVNTGAPYQPCLGIPPRSLMLLSRKERGLGDERRVLSASRFILSTSLVKGSLYLRTLQYLDPLTALKVEMK